MLLQGLKRLIKESELYQDQYKTKKPIQIGFKLTDTGEEASLTFHNKINIEANSSNTIGILTMQSTTFQQIIEGKLDFGALIGRSRMSDVRPINFEIKNSERFPEALEIVKSLMNGFFIPGRIKVRKLSKEYAGDAHGAKPIPIAYWGGMRYAWYHIPAGEVLNRDGEKDPYPQAFMILNGDGILELEDESLSVEVGKVYYIPPNGIHKLHAETDIEMTWLAWDTPP